MPHTDNVNSDYSLTEDQRKHLDFIQAVIARMASTSATIKGLSITLATATYVFATAATEPPTAALGVASVAVFAFLDAYYLRQERLFRDLYTDARLGRVEPYSMDKDSYGNNCSLPSVLRSWSVSLFYGPLVGLGIIAWTWSLVA